MTNFIQRTSGLLSKQECDAVIDYFESNKERQLVGTIGSQVRNDPKKKIDTEIIIDIKELFEDRRLNPVTKALHITFEEYVKNYPFLNRINSWHICEKFKIQRYNPNEAYFVEHCENGGGMDGSMERRLIALMVYLNTVTDGGQTHFPTQNISFSPKVGDILMWPAYWTHPHHGIPSPSQVKYIITGWYNFDDQST